MTESQEKEFDEWWKTSKYYGMYNVEIMNLAFREIALASWVASREYFEQHSCTVSNNGSR